MTGLQYERLKRYLTQEELAEKAGLVAATIMRIETGETLDPIASTLLVLADALECSIEDLLREHPDEGERKRVARKTKIINMENVLLAYKEKTHTTFTELGNILNITREGARNACKRVPAKGKYISVLAAYEGMSEDDLQAEYLGA